MNELLVQTSWWVPTYGLIGAIATLPWAIGLVQRTGQRPAAYFNLLMTVVAFIHGGILFRHTLGHESQQLSVQWLNAAGLQLFLTLDISTISTGAMELITGLSLLAQFFAIGYMEKDWALARFFGLMGFFEGAMSGLALSDSLFLSYGLLEILTLSTYLLVGFWYAQPLVVTAARDAFLTKRVGDVLLLMGVVALGTMAGSFEFQDIYDWAENADLSPMTANLLGLALIAGPIGKCAQFPLHLWLDEAMEGPNPASILRNSVVVACGAYILIKLQPILVLSPLALTALVTLGTVTAIGAAFVSIAQIDIKRVFSHSTSAYLGLVFIAIGMQWTDFALILLVAHGFAKALLFMSVGSIILTTTSQDITEMGGLWKRMPATTFAFLVGSMGLIGLFPLGGFWAFWQGINAFWYDSPVLVLVILLVNGLTAFNLTRVFRQVFLGDSQPKTRRAPEVFWPMAVPMVSLTIVTLVAPAIFDNLSLIPDWELINPLSVVLMVTSILIGIGSGFAVQFNRVWVRPIQEPFRFIQDLLAYDFYVDALYRRSVVLWVSTLSQIGSWCDRYIIDGAINVVGIVSIMGGQSLKYSISGQPQTYALTILIGITVIGLLVSWLV
ncbi:MAG: NAD(P)H-quinone oxidoreductase subunit F [Synechococcales cyanobacterium]